MHVIKILFKNKSQAFIFKVGILMTSGLLCQIYGNEIIGYSTLNINECTKNCK